MHATFQPPPRPDVSSRGEPEPVLERSEGRRGIYSGLSSRGGTTRDLSVEPRSLAALRMKRVEPRSLASLGMTDANMRSMRYDHRRGRTPHAVGDSRDE